MATVHFIMQGKGGVGKSLIASLLFQYLNKHGAAVFGCDTDPVNSSFACYKAFNVKVLNIMRGDDIDARVFDELIEYICDLPPEAHIVVDVGASCFVSICSYIKESDAFGVLRAQGHQLTIHTVVTGGQSMAETMANLEALASHFFDIPLVVWLNSYFGEIALKGQKFHDFKLYEELESSLRAVIEIPPLRPGTFGRDFEELLARHEAFDTAIKSSSLPLMTRQRLAAIWCKLDSTIDAAQLIGG
jgi:hypothetical protein